MTYEEEIIVENAFTRRLREDYYDGELEALKHKVGELERILLALLVKEIGFDTALDIINGE